MAAIDEVESANGSLDQVLIVVGTRPEAIKMVPVILAFKASTRTEPIVVMTGQHTDLVEEVFALGGVTADVNLGVGKPGSTLNTLFSDIIAKLDAYIRGRFGEPDDVGRLSPLPEGYPVACFVHGDTTSAAAAALAAFQLRIPVAHVEAGLRTRNTLSPFPEELNRQLISRIATFHLAPTYRNKENLIHEGVRFGKIFISGNTAIDALMIAAAAHAPYGDPALDDLENDETTPIVVVTAHRRENWGDGLLRIGDAIVTLAERFEGVRFVVPLHPNPRVNSVMRKILAGRPNVTLITPMGYYAFARLLGRATFVITDSGGIQEEAPALGTPVLVVRDSTERQEGVDAGTLELVGTNVQRIVDAGTRLLTDPVEYAERVRRVNPYGDGHAAERIVAACEYIAFNTPAPTPFGSGFERGEVLRAAGYIADPAEPGPVVEASRLVEDLIRG